MMIIFFLAHIWLAVITSKVYNTVQLNMSLKALLYNISLSIKGSIFSQLMNSAYDFNLYIKDTCT